MGKQFQENARDAGFTDEQIDFMWEHLAKNPHTHEIDEINGLDEVLEEVEEEEEE